MRLLIGHVELFLNLFALIKQARLVQILELLVRLMLRIKLVHALLTHFVDRACRCLLFTQNVSLDIIKCLFRFNSRLVEVFNGISLIALCQLHRRAEFQEALPCVL